MSSSDDRYISMLLEQIRDQNQAVLEAVGDIQKQIAEVPTVKEDIKDLKDDTKVIKTAVTDLSRKVNDYEHRITRLEADVA